MIEPFRATQVMVAPLPSWMTVPTGIGTGAPAVVVAAAAFQPSTQVDAYDDPFEYCLTRTL